MNKKRGFTLVELLVVIAVIALLLSILMPVLRKAKDGAMRILCGNHIKNLMLGMMMYADTHNNKIPYTPESNWPWDCQKSVVTELLKSMGTDMSTFPNASLNTAANDVPTQFSTNFYCPSNSRKARYRESGWNYAPAYRVLGYAFLWKGVYNNGGALPIFHRVNGVDVADSSKKWVDRTDMPQASEAELVVDAELSLQVPNDLIHYPNGNFGTILTNYNATGLADSSSHLITDAKVAGGNIGFADGHVEWRSFTEMMHRINRGTGNNGSPIWWWW